MKHWTHQFIRIAGAILLVAGLERLLVAAGTSPTLLFPDPLLGIPLRLAVILVGALELIVACLCLFTSRTNLQLGFLAWLATDYAVFWTGAMMSGCHYQGTCIGSLTDPLNLTDGNVGAFITLIPAGLLFGSYTSLLWSFKKPPAKPAPKVFTGPQKMSCPTCGVHIRFESEQIGQQLACPQCHKPIILRPPEILKTGCVHCHGNIEFPSHALGRKMPCPHCKNDIKLKEVV